MKIQICSDLHLDFRHNKEWIAAHPLKVVGDILIIAGDTYALERNFAKLDFIKKVADEFEAIYLIPGNHEYYGGFDAVAALESTCKPVLDNVFILNNEVVTYGEYQLVFTTMWSHIYRDELAIKQGMMDFHRIRFQQEALQVSHYNLMHKASMAFLERALQQEGKKIVVTHHLPSPECNVAEFKNSLLNPAFCTDKTKLIEQSNVAYWVYGHSHRNLGDFSIGNTRMITNQLGYVGWNEHHSFQYDKVIDLA